MDLRTALRLAFAASLALSLAHCGPVLSLDAGDADGEDTVRSPIVGTWRAPTATAGIATLRTYNADRTYAHVTTITMPSDAESLAGCVTRSVSRGSYSLRGDELTQLHLANTVERSGCADPASDVAQRPGPASESGSRLATYRFAVEAGELRLTTPGGSVLRFTRE